MPVVAERHRFVQKRVNLVICGINHSRSQQVDPQRRYDSQKPLVVVRQNVVVPNKNSLRLLFYRPHLDFLADLQGFLLVPLPNDVVVKIMPRFVFNLVRQIVVRLFVLDPVIIELNLGATAS